MLGFFTLLKRIKAIIPSHYKRISFYFFLLSLTQLLLDVFSIFLLIPLIVSLIEPSKALTYIPLDILKGNPFLLLISVVVFFLVKNYVSIQINKYQAKTAYNLSSEYSVSLAKYYLLGNYLAFKKQKKSAIIKEIIFVTNDFVINFVLSVNVVLTELSFLLIVISIGFYFFFSISLLILLFLGAIVLFLKYFNQKTTNRVNRDHSKDYDANISNLTNLLNGYMSIKSPVILNYFIETFSTSNQKLNRNYATIHGKRINTSRQTEIIIVLLICAVFAYVSLFLSSTFNATLFLSIFGTLLFKAIPSLNKLNVALTNMGSYRYSLNIIEEKLFQISKIEENNTPLHFQKNITLKGVCFQYEDDTPLLKNIHLTIKKGAFVALNGPSGSGKTTLLNIVSKLIDADSGQILLDSIPINHTNKYAYFSLITYLTQNPFIYEGTVFDNLVLNHTVIPEEEIKSILTELDILKVVEGLPKGLHNYIGVQGSNLSGGQLQRICIARALLSKPQVLILDEATNNLDLKTEVKVLEFIKVYSKKHNITVISVSHNLDYNNGIYDNVFKIGDS